MLGARPVSLLSLACLSACVAQPSSEEKPYRGTEFIAVAVNGRDLAVKFGDYTVGTMLTGQGAVPVAGRSLQVTGYELGRDEGIISKEAARLACADAGGAFQPQAIGRYPAQGMWVFDGACA